MTMSRKKLKLMFAGAVLACAFGLIALRVAWATPGSGVFTTLIGVPVTLEEMNLRTESDTHEVELKTRGEWQTRVVHYRIVPGGHTGWHSHPGPVFVMVNSGRMTKYEAADGTRAVYPAGTGFVEPGGEAHLARNEENVDLELVAFFLIPQGANPRTDERAP